MPDLGPLFESNGIVVPPDDQSRFLVALTVFPGAFDLKAAAAAGGAEAAKTTDILARLVGRRLVRLIKTGPPIWLWAMTAEIRALILCATSTRELISRAQVAHSEYFLGELRGTAVRSNGGCDTDRDYLEFMRANLELAASRRIRQMVGSPAEPGPPIGLTRRQWQVAQLVAAGLTNYQIATSLGIAEWTAVNHVRSVMQRLGCGSRVDVTRAVIASGKFDGHGQPCA